MPIQSNCNPPTSKIIETKLAQPKTLDEGSTILLIITNKIPIIAKINDKIDISIKRKNR